MLLKGTGRRVPPASEVLRGRWRVLLSVTLIAATLVLLLVAWLNGTGRVSASLMLADVRAVGDLPMSAGLLSDIGVLIWWSSACVCMFTALVVFTRRGRDCRVEAVTVAATLASAAPTSTKGLARYLVASGGLTGVLALDDALMMHERLLPALLGIEQHTVYLFYVISLLLWMVAFRRRIHAFLPGWLLVGLSCFALSVGLDLLPEGGHAESLPPMLEDGLKWIGIVLWSGRLWGECLQSLTVEPDSVESSVPT